MWAPTLLTATTLAAEWPDLSTAGPTAPGDGSRDAALVVGIEDYTSVEDVVGARRVAEEWYRWLAESRRVPLDRLHRLTDRQAVDHKIRSELVAAASEAQTGGMLWIVFVGHGAPSGDGHDGLLIGADADRSADGVAQRSVLRSEVIRAAEGSSGTPVLVLDACFSGQTGTGAALVPGLQPVVPTWAVERGQRSVVLTATSSGEFAGGLPGAGRPAFGYLVLGALRGWGDANGDGVVSAGEVVAYAKGALRATVTDRTQTPTLLGPDVTLVNGKERGPDVVSLALTATPTPPPKGTDFSVLAAKAMAAEEELRRAEEELRRAEEARQLGLLEAARTLQAQATSDFRAIEQLVSTPTVGAKAVFEAFVSQYTAATVTVAGVTQPVEVAELPQVRAALQELEDGRSGGAGVTSPTVGRLVWVPPGTFTMGSPNSQPGRHDDEGQHEVRLTKGFYLMEHEVTQGEWQAVMGSNPSLFTACGPSCPVEQVSWKDATKFAKRLSAREGVVYRLPTEAEWEYAASAGEVFAWPGSTEASDVAWTSANGLGTTHPVCELTRNAWGLCDLSGNVAEWVADWYGSYESAVTDPLGAAEGSHRVYRGGCWSQSPWGARVAFRNWEAPNYRLNDLGFRLARDP